MKLSVNYNEILEESLMEELEWLKEEFILLFKSNAQKYSERDKMTANAILNYIIDNLYVNDNMILLTLFTEAIETIEKTYPYLF
jgi:hypothetical protein